MININNLPPFKKMCVTIGNLPSSFVESMSYYEALCWMYNYLDKTVIPAINTEGEAITELQTAFTTLKTYVDNYFENLDVQEEINNKLDAMAEAGTLTDIIAQYLGLAGVLAYNTVADMKAAENLVDGSTAKTLGYHTLNDNGGANYKIRTITNDDVVDEMTIIALYDNTLIAELIKTDTMYPEQFGAYGDNSHDDTLSLQTCLNTCNNSQLKGIYLVNDTIDINNNIFMDGNSYIKASETLSILVTIAKNSQKIGREFHINVDCNGICTTGIAVGSPRKCNLDLKVINAGATGINCNYYNSSGNNENIFTCNVIGNSSGTTVRGVLCNCFDNIFHSITTQDCQRGVEVNAGELVATSIHSWISNGMDTILWDNSYVVYNAGYYLQMIDWLYQDSVKYGIYGASYGKVKYFEYNNTLTTVQTNFVNVKCESGSNRLTIDYFKNSKVEAQPLKYDLGSSNAHEFGVLVKNGVGVTTSQIETYQPFTDCDDAPQWGGFWVKWDTTNVPAGINGYLKSEVIGVVVQQTYITNTTSFAEVPRYWIRFRQLGSNTWTSWQKFTPSA